ncbi:phage tail domain-containing protein [Staphylococcus warneri]|uniref:phage tail domain-containing protein n=1 Tax=Staphylococcus warneri TaxID=1292 RepID=UPI001FB3D5FB|nr:phage tail domain-containing protein [Staphylococcus warneri]MCJ1786289.1 phage tail family protein [Staphylococcus warneri]MCJ1788776.1 phage tail family protein [Staphylococcus warneri]MCJ1791204.1 phage tail family protein [Staphylococcus warneri]MCJ1793663.1 phage tail family protein [Staphylococcus warneri]MCJ1796120.1 phage tail family protein [Staphylococcus warneri]
MIDDRWLKIVTDNETIDINDVLPNFMFLDAKAAFPTTNNESTTMKGVDGELPNFTTFAPFSLVVKCGFDGIDVIDATLAEQKLRNIFFKRKPYYIITSDNPCIKYAVKNPDINPDYGDYMAVKFELTFSVYKGYSESLKSTDKFSLSSGDWQFEEGLIFDDNIKYNHSTSSFKIFNGSDDTINPILRHKFRLDINIDAPNGFTITNKTTGDVFEYTKPIKSNKTLSIQGVHPILNNKRVGVDTNFNFLTLDPGYNDIEISGSNLGKTNTKWVFPFIYR